MKNRTFLLLPKQYRALFIDAWEDSFNRKLSPEIYDWIFNDINKIYVFIEDNKVIAGYCLYPLDAFVEGRSETALLCNNVFVRPDHQGRNLFVLLGKQALQHAEEENYGSVAFGIPNPLALPGHKRVGWKTYPQICFLEKIRGPSRIHSEVEWINKPLTESLKDAIEKCSIRASNGRDFSIIKNKKFFTWRFDKKPGVKYTYGLVRTDSDVLAYCVCKYYAQSKTLHFIDIDGYSPTAIESLIKSADALPDDFYKTNVWDTTAHHYQFRSLGYETVNTKDNLIIKNIEAGVNLSIKNINLVFADNDVY